eukprot:scaffold7307_cov48-Phaeocystis_antarctica.AAC.7
MALAARLPPRATRRSDVPPPQAQPPCEGGRGRQLCRLCRGAPRGRGVRHHRAGHILVRLRPAPQLGEWSHHSVARLRRRRAVIAPGRAGGGETTSSTRSYQYRCGLCTALQCFQFCGSLNRLKLCFVARGTASRSGRPGCPCSLGGRRSLLKNNSKVCPQPVLCRALNSKLTARPLRSQVEGDGEVEGDGKSRATVNSVVASRGRRLGRGDDRT